MLVIYQEETVKSRLPVPLGRVWLERLVVEPGRCGEPLIFSRGARPTKIEDQVNDNDGLSWKAEVLTGEFDDEEGAVLVVNGYQFERRLDLRVAGLRRFELSRKHN